MKTKKEHPFSNSAIPITNPNITVSKQEKRGKKGLRTSEKKD